MKLYMIDKGEYYMEHENVDEAIAFQTACKKVKQIANAIKTIRMKYYPNFAKISDEDKQTYEELHLQIDKIARENGLNMLNTELIADINDRFQDSQNEADANKQEKPAEKILKAYYGAIDAGNQALSEGKLRRALNCQKQANSFMEQLEAIAQEDLLRMAVEYKRARFAELSQERGEKEQVTTNWEQFLQQTYKTEDFQKRNDIAQEILQNAKRSEQAKHPVAENKDTQEILLET